jgi:hypothetical protein
MTQLVTVSATTAALNIELLKVPRRISVKDQVADIKADADRNARRAENADPDATDTMLPPATVSLDLMESGQQPHQQATIREAEAAYREMEE